MNSYIKHDIPSAISIVKDAHKDQTYGPYPYIKHLEDVYQILIEFGFGFVEDKELLIGAWFHDILEDTNTKYHRLKINFGERVAEMVYDVTDEMGRNRKERKKKTYPKIRENGDSMILKLADRIANIRFSSFSPFGDNNKIDMYRKEAKEFESELRNRFDYRDNPEYGLKVIKMWEHIDELLKENK